MTFATIETSRDDGRPVELYQFSYTLNAWYYTSADRDIDYNTNTYKSAPMMRTALQPSADPTKASLTVTVPGDSPLGDIFRIQPPSEPVIVTILGEHFLDGSVTTLWKGRIKGAEWKSDQTLELTSESVFSSMQRAGLRRRYQYSCPFALYGEDCGVDREVFKEAAVVNSISGVNVIVLSAAGKPAGWYSGGYATWVNETNKNIEKRMIRDFDTASGTLVLSSIPVGLSGAQAIMLYPGCDHTLEGANGCAPKFVNFVRFGGTPYIPTKNPFSGSSIY